MKNATQRGLVPLMSFVMAGICYSAEIPLIISKMIQTNDNIKNYEIEYNVKKKIAFNTSPSEFDDSRYVEYELNVKTAFDRGKRSFEYTEPLIINGKGIVPEKKIYLRQIYDGTKIILWEHNSTAVDDNLKNHYTVSRKPERHDNPTSLETMYSKVLTQLVTQIKTSKVTFLSSKEGKFDKLECLFPERQEKIILSYSDGKDVLLNKFQRKTLDNKLLCEYVAYDYRELSKDAWLPMNGTLTVYNEKGSIIYKDSYRMSKAKVNEPTIAPALFEMKIPPDAAVFHEDIGLMIFGKEINNIENVEFNVFEKKERIQKKLSQEQEEKASSSKKRNTGHFVQPRSNTDLKPKTSSVLRHIILFLLTALVIILLLLFTGLKCRIFSLTNKS